MSILVTAVAAAVIVMPIVAIIALGVHGVRPRGYPRPVFFHLEATDEEAGPFLGREG